jgi:DNA-binding ferritin-like protein
MKHNAEIIVKGAQDLSCNQRFHPGSARGLTPQPLQRKEHEMSATSTLSFNNGEVSTHGFSIKKSQTDKAKQVSVETISTLNLTLAELLDLESRIKHAAWNVKGEGTHGVHQQMNDFRADLSHLARRIASRVKVLGGAPSFILAKAADISKLRSYPAQAATMAEHVDALQVSYAAAISTLPQNMRFAMDSKDYPTASLITDVAAMLEEHQSRLSAQLPGHWTHQTPGTAVNQ